MSAETTTAADAAPASRAVAGDDDKDDGGAATLDAAAAAAAQAAMRRADSTAASDDADAKKAPAAVPFLATPLDNLRELNAEQMEALMHEMVTKTTPDTVKAQKDAHDAEIESMQKLMMDAQQEGLLNDDDDVDGEADVDEDGVEKQTTADGSILLKNKAGDHNPVLDELRKKQRRGQLSREEEEGLARALAYQRRMTGAIGTETLPDDDNATVACDDAHSGGGGSGVGGAHNAKAPPTPTTPTTSTTSARIELKLPCTMTQASMRGIMLPLVSPSGSAQVPGNTLVTTVRIDACQRLDDSVAFVLGTVRSGGNQQDPDNKPQRWADVKSPITGAELNENGGSIEIECAQNDVVFNASMVGITLLSGELPQSALVVALDVTQLDENEFVGAVGAHAPKVAKQVAQKAGAHTAVAPQQQQQQRAAPSATTGNALQRAVQRQRAQQPQQSQQQQPQPPPQRKKANKSGGARFKGNRRFAPSAARPAAARSAAHAANGGKEGAADDDDDDEVDPRIAADDETHTLRPQLPPGVSLQPQVAPTRKQLAADPNNPKFDPQPVKERLNIFSTDEEGRSIAPPLPDGVAGYAADGTPIPLDNDGDQFNPQIPDVFDDREYRNALMRETYVPEKDKPIFYNRKMKYAVVSVIGPHHCRIKTDRCVMRVWGFAKNKKEVAAIEKWVRANAYMPKIWDVLTVPLGGWFPIPPIFAENATSTYSNPMHRQYMEAYLKEQKRATIELEQRVLDDRLMREKSGNTMAKQLARKDEERHAAAQQMQQQRRATRRAPGATAAGAAAAAHDQTTATTTSASSVPRHRAPLAQRIRAT